MPDAKHLKAVKEGWITRKQYDKLPPHLLEAIIKSKKKSGKKVKEWSESKGEARKGKLPGSRLAFDATKQEKKKVAKKKKDKDKKKKGDKKK